MQKHTIGYVCPGPMLLRWYCVYVLVIALNGITECFVTATMSQQEVNKYNRIMIGLSLLFLFSALALTRLAGSVGFIWANCLNMMARITHSVYFIYEYYSGTGQQPLKGLFPSKQVLVVLLVSFIVMAQSEKYFCCNIGLYIVYHVAIGVVCLAVTAGSIFIGEKQFIQFTLKRLFHKQN
jgi:oligosaccharide translocation protein RFT1